MRFLYFTDTHIRGTNPQNRLDNFYLSLQKKIREIFDLAKEHHADVVLHGGDIFDRPDISPSLVRELILLINEYSLPIYAVAGNHDIYGQNPITINRTMLGLLDGIGIISIIDRDKKIFFRDHKTGANIQLTGQSYFYGIDHSEGLQSYIIQKDPSADYAIHLVHGMLMEKPFFEGASCTLIENILDTQADITLAGHYHTGFDMKFINGKYFLNPGSVARINNSISELSRRPKVYLIDIGSAISIKEIELKSALPGLDVLDRSKVEALAFKEKKLSDFVQSVYSAGTYNSIDISSIIEQVSKHQNIKAEVILETLKRIGQAQELLASGDISEVN